MINRIGCLLVEQPVCSCLVPEMAEESLSKTGRVVLQDGKNVVLKVEKNEDYVMPSRVNPCLKYSLFTLNYILLLFSIALIGLGVWAQLDKSAVITNLKKFDPNSYVVFLDPSILIVLLGIVILVVSFCGAVGSLRDNCFYLMLYVCMMGCLLVTYLMLIAIAATSGRILVNVIRTTIEDTIIQYRDDPDLQLFVDWVQINLRCCGASSPQDWNDNIYFSDWKTLAKFKSPEAGGVPYSCCKRTTASHTELQNTLCGLNARRRPNGGEWFDPKSSYLRNDIHDKGCIEMIKSFMIQNVVYIAPAVVILILLQLFCLFFACTLQNQIFEQREEWYRVEKLKVFVYDQ